MKARRLVPRAFGAAVAVLGLAGAATAADTTWHGSVCQPSRVLIDGPKVEYGQFGAHNKDTGATAMVRCGSGYTTGATLNRVDVMVYDRHPQASVTCRLVLTDLFGNLVRPVESRSSAAAIEPAVKVLTFLFQPGAATHALSLECQIPANVGFGLSHVAAYRVMTQ
jgi:hypothetical protein